MPSTSVNRAPVAVSTKTGNEPGQRVIHGIGTPASSEAVGLLGERGGAGMELDEAALLGLGQLGQAVAVDGRRGHGANLGVLAAH